MVLAFVVCWVPFGWMYFLPLAGLEEKGTLKTTAIIPLLFVKLGCTIMNPLVYSFDNIEVSCKARRLHID